MPFRFLNSVVLISNLRFSANKDCHIAIHGLLVLAKLLVIWIPFYSETTQIWIHIIFVNTIYSESQHFNPLLLATTFKFAASSTCLETLLAELHLTVLPYFFILLDRVTCVIYLSCNHTFSVCTCGSAYLQWILEILHFLCAHVGLYICSEYFSLKMFLSFMQFRFMRHSTIWIW